jgi:hypothetical protein
MFSLISSNQGIHILGRIALLVIAVPTASQGAVPKEPSPSPQCTLASHARAADWWKARIAWGRLELTTSRVGAIEYVSSNDGKKEAISLSANASRCRVHYRMSDSRQTLEIVVDRDGRVDLKHEIVAGAKATSFTFEQRADVVTIRLVAGERRQTVEAPTIWHLWIVEPALCRDYLAPILAVLARDSLNATKMATVETHLLKMAERDEIPSLRRWDAWIRKLADDRFVQRRDAQVSLQREGPAVLWRLETREKKRDAEQQYRIHLVRRCLRQAPPEDTSEKTAQWLSGDPRIWRAMAQRNEAKSRRLAQRALRQLTDDASRGSRSSLGTQ